MRVMQISFFVDPMGRSPEQLMEDWAPLSDIALAAATGGVEVEVIQASTNAGEQQLSGVRFFFIPPVGRKPRLTGSSFFRERITEFQPDLFHVHGLCFPDEVRALKRIAPQIPVLVQDHASHPPRPWRRRSWRLAAPAISGASFCSASQALAFTRTGLLLPTTRIFELPESTCRFAPGNRTEARLRTGIFGDPAVLWVGHLNKNKDPLTILDAVAHVLPDLPGLQLWCCFGTAPLKKPIDRWLRRRPDVGSHVHLLGRVPHAQIEILMRAADIFVLASHREGCNFSLMEALATGLTPVVSDIPSSRALLADGTIGELWQCGDSRAAAAALARAEHNRNADTRDLIRKFFEATLSGKALGQQLAAAYSALCKDRSNSNKQPACNEVPQIT